VLVLLDGAAFPGCLVKCRIIGAIEAEQSENGETFRNDRMLAVWTGSRTHDSVKSLKDLNKSVIKEIEEFFVAYHKILNKPFRPLSWVESTAAIKLIKKAEGE